jgi:hypothetical protein
MQIDFKQKIVAAFENLAPNQLISDIHLTDEEYLDLIDLVKRRIKNLLSHVTTIPPVDEFLSLALVQIGVREYEDGNYWGYFDKLMDENFSTAFHTYFGNIFLSTLDKYKLFKHRDDKTVNRNYYVQNILMHGFVPKNYYHDFFSFLVSFYEKNLMREIPEDINESFDDLCIYMMEALKSKKDEIGIVELSGKPTRYYKLNKSTQRVLAEESIASSRRIMSNLLDIIDKFYWYRELPESEATDLSEIHIIEWLKQGPDEFKEKLNKSGNLKKRLFNQNPYLRFNYDKFVVELLIPPRKLRESDFKDSVYVEIEIENEAKRYKLDSYRGYGVINTEEKAIPIEMNLFSEINLKIVSNMVLADFVVEPQDFLFFTTNSDMFQLSSMDTGNVILIAKPGVNVVFPEGSTVMEDEPQELGFGTFYYLTIEEESVFFINDVPMSFSLSFNEGIIMDGKITEVQFFDQYKNELIATRRHPVVFFKQTMENTSDMIITVNGMDVKLESHAITKIPIPNEFEYFGAKVDLMDILPIESKRYSISLSYAVNKEALKIDYLLIPDFSVIPDEKVYIYKKYALVKFTCSQLIESLDQSLVVSYNEFKLQLSKDLFRFSIKLENTYFFHYTCPILSWRFNDSEWNYEQVEYVWIDDADSNLSIRLPNVRKISLIEMEDSIKVKESYSNSPLLHEFDLTDWLVQFRKSTIVWRNIMLRVFFTDNTTKMLTLFKVLTSMVINKFEVYPNPENSSLVCLVDYIGPFHLYMDVFDLGIRENVYKNLTLNNGTTNLDLTSNSKSYRFELNMDDSEKKPKNEIQEPLLRHIHIPNLARYELYLKTVFYEDGIFDVQNSEYRIIEIEEDPKNCEEYFGKMECKNQLNVISTLCDRVKITKPLVGSKLIIQCFDTETKAWTNFVYDKATNELLTMESEILNTPGIKMERFLFLYEDEVDFEVEHRRIDE